MRGLNGERMRPSPCSEEFTPSNSATSSTISLGDRAHRLDLVGLGEVDERADVQAADRAVPVEAGVEPVRGRGSPRSARRSRRAARARPPCPRRTRPAAGGPRSPPSAARARPCGPWSARPGRPRSRRAACGRRGRALPGARRAVELVAHLVLVVAGEADEQQRARVALQTVGEARGTRAWSARARGSCGRSSRPRDGSQRERVVGRRDRAGSESKCPTANILAFGSSTSRTVAAVTIASVPSEPTTQLGEVERVQPVEPVAAGLAPVLRVVLGDRPRVLAQDRLDAGVEAALELLAAPSRRERRRASRRRARPRARGRGRSSCRGRSTRCPRSCCRSCRRASPGSTSTCPARSRARSASRRG